MLRYALIALIAVVSAEDAITVTQSTPASAYVSCNSAWDTGTASSAVDATGEHLITITHGRCKLELKPMHVNGDATVGHMFKIDGEVSDPAEDSGDHTGHFETRYEDLKNSVTSGEACDMDSHNKVEFQPVIDSSSNNLQVTVILTPIDDNGQAYWSNQYQSGYEFKQYYDDALLTATGTNYAANSDSWQKLVNMAALPGTGGSTTTFTWASGCDDAVAPVDCTASNNFETDITCTHIVTGTNPKGLIRATHSTVNGHTKHKCWVDHTVANALTDPAACKCQCVL